MSQLRSKSGSKSFLFDVSKGSLIEGTGALALTANTWYLVNSQAATGSQLPVEVGQWFKTGATPPTPIADDDVYPLTFTKVCTADVSFNTTLGTIEVTDSCSDGQIQKIPDGFIDFSGSANGYLKFNSPNGGIQAVQKSLLGEHFDIIDDDGADGYVITSKGDGYILIAVLQDTDADAENEIQPWLMGEVILTGITMAKALKGVQSIDLTFEKGETPVFLYNRTTNAAEDVF